MAEPNLTHLRGGSFTLHLEGGQPRMRALDLHPGNLQLRLETHRLLLAPRLHQTRNTPSGFTVCRALPHFDAGLLAALGQNIRKATKTGPKCPHPSGLRQTGGSQLCKLNNSALCFTAPFLSCHMFTQKIQIGVHWFDGGVS